MRACKGQTEQSVFQSNSPALAHPFKWTHFSWVSAVYWRHFCVINGLRTGHCIWHHCTNSPNLNPVVMVTRSITVVIMIPSKYTLLHVTHLTAAPYHHDWVIMYWSFPQVFNSLLSHKTVLKATCQVMQLKTGSHAWNQLHFNPCLFFKTTENEYLVLRMRSHVTTADYMETLWVWNLTYS